MPYCWRPGNPRNQGINNHGIYLFVAEYAGLGIRKIKLVDKIWLRNQTEALSMLLEALCVGFTGNWWIPITKGQ